MPRGRRSAQAGTLLAVLLLAGGCGGSDPEPLEPMEPEVPADLCSTIPAELKTGLVSNSNTDTTGNPTAACSLRSPVTSKREVRVIVTWVQLNDEDNANTVLDSQCNAINPQEFKEQAGFQAEGADRACAAVGTLAGADSATLVAVADREVLTVRFTELPPGQTPALARGQQMLEGVLAEMAG